MKATLQRINDEIAAAGSILLTTHEGPDGDAIGSTLALALHLDRLGKDVTVYCVDPCPELYLFLPRSGKVLNHLPDERSFDLCIILDVGDFRRAGNTIVSCNRIGKFINIDHHPDCDRFAAVNLIDPDACATGAIVHRLIRNSGYPIDAEMALCIYTAVITDTGSFRYSNANPEAFTIAAEMVSLGVNTWYVAEKLYESQPQGRLELLARALTTLKVSKRGTLASIVVTLDMYEQTGTSAEITDGFVNYPRSIRGVEVALFFREITSGLVKVGFRSKGNVDVSRLAAAFDGGGHHNAAGCTVAGTVNEVRDRVTAHVDLLL